jgi:predicted amidohydrolase YtcJ
LRNLVNSKKFHGDHSGLIVLDRNPLTVPAADIANTKVLETVVAGDVVHTIMVSDHN